MTLKVITEIISVSTTVCPASTLPGQAPTDAVPVTSGSTKMGYEGWHIHTCFGGVDHLSLIIRVHI